jgi:STE24 endopeptidase
MKIIQTRDKFICRFQGDSNIMSVPEVAVDNERQELAKEYARIRRRLMLVELLIGGLYALTWLVFGWSSELKGILLSITDNEWILVAFFGLVFGGIYYLITLPLSYYSGFSLPHRFGLSTQTLREWVVDQIKGLGIGLILGGILIETIYVLLRIAPDNWWIWAALIMLFFNVLLANLAPVILFPIFYKFVPLGDDHAELVERLIALAKEANTYVKGVFIFDMSSRTTAANAGLTGIGNTRRIILGDTLIEEFPTDEIETVLAHELGHHVNKDIPLGILIESLITLIGFFLASSVLDWGTLNLGFYGPSDIAAMPLFILVMGFFGLITMPLGNAYSRWRERLADTYAIEITGNGSAYASALMRLANQNLSELNPEPWVEFLFYSHPSLGKRIKNAETASEIMNTN